MILTSEEDVVSLPFCELLLKNKVFHEGRCCCCNTGVKFRGSGVERNEFECVDGTD